MVPWRNFWGQQPRLSKSTSSCGITFIILGGAQIEGSPLTRLTLWVSKGTCIPQYGQEILDHRGAAKQYGWSCGSCYYNPTSRVSEKRRTIEHVWHIDNHTWLLKFGYTYVTITPLILLVNLFLEGRYLERKSKHSRHSSSKYLQRIQADPGWRPSCGDQPGQWQGRCQSYRGCKSWRAVSYDGAWAHEGHTQTYQCPQGLGKRQKKSKSGSSFEAWESCTSGIDLSQDQQKWRKYE